MAARKLPQFAVIAEDDDSVIHVGDDYQKAVQESEEQAMDTKGDYPDSEPVIGIYQLVAKTTASLTAQTKAVPR